MEEQTNRLTAKLQLNLGAQQHTAYFDEAVSRCSRLVCLVKLRQITGQIYKQCLGRRVNKSVRMCICTHSCRLTFQRHRLHFLLKHILMFMKIDQTANRVGNHQFQGRRLSQSVPSDYSATELENLSGCGGILL